MPCPMTNESKQSAGSFRSRISPGLLLIAAIKHIADCCGMPPMEVEDSREPR